MNFTKLNIARAIQRISIQQTTERNQRVILNNFNVNSNIARDGIYNEKNCVIETITTLKTQNH